MNHRWWVLLLKVCVSLTLVGRGWLTWQADSPIRGLIWKEDWWSPFIDDWSNFAKHSDSGITLGLSIIGIILILGAVLPWLGPRFHRYLWIMTGLLALDSIARWVGKDYDVGMAIEHALQMVAPIALLYYQKTALWQWLILVATAFTFIGHGLYAMGFHPVPLIYQTMTMNILSVSQETALSFLSVVGWLDVVFAICLFITPLRLLSLGYVVIWGGATALARIVAHGDIDPWLFETLVRTPHWLLPLLLFFQLSQLATLRSESTGSSSSGQYSSPT